MHGHRSIIWQCRTLHWLNQYLLYNECPRVGPSGTETWAIMWSEFDRRYWHLLPEWCKTWPGNGEVFILTKKYTNGGLKLNLKQNGTVLMGGYNVLHAFHLQNNQKSSFIRAFIKCRATDVRHHFVPSLLDKLQKLSEWTVAHQHHVLGNGTCFSCLCIGEVGLSVCFRPPIVQGFSIRWANVTQHCFFFIPPPRIWLHSVFFRLRLHSWWISVKLILPACLFILLVKNAN